jgi:hypothetical protein
MKEINGIGIGLLITFVLVLLLGIFTFPKKPFDNSTTWYTAKVIIGTNPQQVHYVKSTYRIEAHAKWGHNNLNCNNISSTAPIIVTDQKTYIEHSYPCNLFWTRFWFIIALFVVWIVSSLFGLTFFKP